MAYYYYLCVLYFRVLLLHFSYTHTNTYTHTPRHSGILTEKPYIFIDFIGYNKSHTQRQQLHLLLLTVVECASLAHTPFRCIASGIRDLYTFVTSSHPPMLRRFHPPQQIYDLKS